MGRMDKEQESLSSAAAELRHTIEQLRSAVSEANDVRDQLSDLTHKSKSNRSLINVVGVMAVVNLLIVVAVVIMGVQMGHLIEVQRDSALCPLYGIFLQNDTPEGHERAIAQGQDPEFRKHAFEVIRNSYDALECSEDISK